jgi:DNA-binding MurR/RpiR family transcriptional regulator
MAQAMNRKCEMDLQSAAHSCTAMKHFADNCCTKLDQTAQNNLKIKHLLQSEEMAASLRCMERHEFTIKVKQAYDDLPGRVRAVAQYVLDNPHDVALLSMREQARRASVPPATMTRFAQHLGLAGFEEVRAIHADALRDAPEAFSGRAETLVKRHREVGSAGVAIEIVQSLKAHISELATPSRIEQLTSAAKDLAKAKRIYCLGHRSSFPAAFQFAHIMSFFDRRAILLEAAGASGTAAILEAGPGDVLLVVSFLPAARQVVEAVAFARRHGVRIIAVTRSETTPVGRLADRVILVSSNSPSFFDTMTPAFATCEMLVALVAGLHKDDVPTAVRETEQRLWDLGAWWGQNEYLPPVSPSASRKKSFAVKRRRAR